MLLAAGAAQAQVVMRGDVGIRLDDNRARVWVEDITNFGGVDTDRLRFRLWASEDEWRDGGDRELLSVMPVGRLRAHENRSEIRRKGPLWEPDSGWYYVTLVLEERSADQTGAVRWVPRDRVEFDGRFYISKRFNPFWPF
jgi:hypothetical protein